MIIYDYLTDISYARKINKKNIYQQYKLGILNDTDPQHLSNISMKNSSMYTSRLGKELDRLEKEFSDEEMRQSGALSFIEFERFVW